jgi:F-type H+-transporting ATPase subunit a
MSAAEAVINHGKAVAEAHGGGGEVPELKNLVDYIAAYFHKGSHDIIFGHGIMSFTYTDLANVVFSFIIVIALAIVAIRVRSKLQRIPKGGQALVELFVAWMNSFVSSIIGEEHGPAFTPFIGTIFLFILCMNLSGLIPFYKSPIALNINMPLSVAICVFLFVQYHGIRQNGIKGYLKHFKGEGSGTLLDIILTPLNIVLHIMGEFIKPLSLTLRLFGNITGEDVVIAVLVSLMVGISFFPIPVQILFFPLALLFSMIQALVFTSLSAAYILLMSKHEEHEGH